MTKTRTTHDATQNGTWVMVDYGDWVTPEGRPVRTYTWRRYMPDNGGWLYKVTEQVGKNRARYGVSVCFVPGTEEGWAAVDDSDYHDPPTPPPPVPDPEEPRRPGKKP